MQAMHRVTDIYGPLPYTAFGKMSSGLPYDSQETVYRTFIKELDHALKTLKAAYEADSGAKPIADFDVVFDSDLEKWIRFANSLKLRLAMRARFAAPGDAQTWAEEAVNFQFGAYNIGVMTDNTHSAQLLTRTGIGFSYKHPLEYLWGEYNECRMGATMESYLSGYGDPRLESYFSPAEKDGAYHGIPNGIISNPKDYQSLASCPKVGFTSPLNGCAPPKSASCGPRVHSSAGTWAARPKTSTTKVSARRSPNGARQMPTNICPTAKALR